MGVALSAVAVFISCHNKRDHKIPLSIFISSRKTNRQGTFRGDKWFHSLKYGSLNLIHIVAELGKQRIGSCLASVYRVMDARRKFGEHERSVRILAS